MITFGLQLTRKIIVHYVHQFPVSAPVIAPPLARKLKTLFGRATSNDTSPQVHKFVQGSIPSVAVRDFIKTIKERGGFLVGDLAARNLALERPSDP